MLAWVRLRLLRLSRPRKYNSRKNGKRGGCPDAIRRNMPMKWTRTIAAAAALLSATACLAEMPQSAADQPSAMSLMQRGRLLGSGPNWWNRYGEPVNAAALNQDVGKDGAPAPGGPMPAYGDGYA